MNQFFNKSGHHVNTVFSNVALILEREREKYIIFIERNKKKLK